MHEKWGRGPTTLLYPHSKSGGPIDPLDPPATAINVTKHWRDSYWESRI